MASPKTTIADAFEKLQRSLSEEHRHSFESTELEHVWSAVRDIQTAQRKRQSAQNLRRIEPLLQGLEKYAKVIEVLCNGTPYLSSIWAPIKLMIQLASQHRDIFEALLDAYADIGNALPRFDRYQKTFEDNPEFQFVLAGVYSAILEFHQRAYKFFQCRAWHIIFLSFWKDFQARFQGIIRTLEKHRDFVDKEAASIDIVEDRVARVRILEDIEERRRQTLAVLESNEKNNRLAQLQASLSWLSADDRKQEAERLRRSALRHPGTCEWIEQVSEMTAWVKDDTSASILWLSGKPGAGKSVMCSYVVDMLARVRQLDFCYYFCNNQDDGNDNPSEQILATIAIQLLRAHRELSSLITNEFVSRGLSSGLTQLRVLVPKLLEMQPYTRIVVDGIDECSKGGQKALLNELRATCGHETRCKILISSRKEPGIRDILDGKPKISLDKNDKVESDIQRYISHKIQDLQSSFDGQFESEVFNKIASLLAEKADGMFLWVKLVAKELEQSFSRKELEERAKSLPHGLKDAYGRILDRILDEEVSPHIRSLSVRILEWIACSYRRLKIHEILDGVSFNPNCTSLNSDTKLHKRVLDLCRPLIEDGPSNTVIFVHFSAQEYILTTPYRQGRPFIIPEDAHLNIGYSCITYLNTSMCLLPQHSSKKDRMLLVLEGLHGLQIYANQYWSRHLMAYIGEVTARKLSIPQHFGAQLKELLKFRKLETCGDSLDSHKRSELKDRLNVDLPSVDKSFILRDLVSDLETFRSGLKRRDWSRKSSEGVSLEACDSDPTWFASVRHYYQISLETLMSLKPAEYPENVSSDSIQNYRETYGASAFVCRYLHCNRAADGFDTVQLREKHESQHRRQYRCQVPTCVLFETGFATRGKLNQHERNYHSQVSDGASLADAIRAFNAGKLDEAVAPDREQSMLILDERLSSNAVGTEGGADPLSAMPSYDHSPTTLSGLGSRGRSTTRRPRITKADRARMEQEKLERERMGSMAKMPGNYGSIA